MLNVEEFWNIADETRLETEYRVDEKLQFLQTASLEALQKNCALPKNKVSFATGE